MSLFGAAQALHYAEELRLARKRRLDEQKRLVCLLHAVFLIQTSLIDLECKWERGEKKR